jgi:hypothetical protein
MARSSCHHGVWEEMGYCEHKYNSRAVVGLDAGQSKVAAAKIPCFT